MVALTPAVITGVAQQTQGLSPNGTPYTFVYSAKVLDKVLQDHPVLMRKFENSVKVVETDLNTHIQETWGSSTGRSASQIRKSAAWFSRMTSVSSKVNSGSYVGNKKRITGIVWLRARNQKNSINGKDSLKLYERSHGNAEYIMDKYQKFASKRKLIQIWY